VHKPLVSVEAFVLRRWKHLKVFGPVIPALLVAVVNVLSGSKWSARLLFDDVPVQEFGLATALNSFVAVDHQATLKTAASCA
jgi:hypothetical protein